MNKFTVLIAIAALVAGCTGDSRTVAERVSAAEVLYESKSYRAAAIELKSALQDEPTNARARTLLGLAAFSVGDLDGAEKELSRAIQLGAPATDTIPTYAQVLLSLGKEDELLELKVDGLDSVGSSSVKAAKAMLLARNGEVGVALVEIDKVLDDPPVSAFALVTGARLSLSRDRSAEEAKYLIEQALALDETNGPALILKGDLAAQEGEIEVAEQAYGLSISGAFRPFGAHYKRGLLRATAGDLSLAGEDIAAMEKLVPKHPGVAFLRGTVALREEALDVAMENFSLASEAASLYPQSLYYLAALQRQAGSLEIARANSSRFLTFEPNNIRALKLAATVSYELKEHERVLELLEPVLSTSPDDVYTLNLLANSLMALGSTDQGMRYLERVAQLEPDSSQALTRLGAGLLVTGDSSRGIANLQAAQRLNPGDNATEIALINGYLRDGQMDSALAQIQELAELRPEDSFPLNLEGQIMMITGDLDQAGDVFSAAQSVAPNETYASLSLAQIALKKGDVAEARKQFELVLADTPNHLQALVGLASVEALQSNEQAMVELLRQSIEFHPGAVEPRLVLSRYFLARGDTDQAADLLLALPEQRQQYVPVLNILAEIEFKRQRFNAAIAYLKQVVEQEPKNPHAYFLLARGQVQIGDADAAVDSLESALDLAPGFLNARIALTRLYLRTDNLAAAKGQLRSLLRQAPDNPDVLKLQASIAAKDGDTEQTQASLEEAYSLAPTALGAIQVAALRRANGDTEGALSLLEEWNADNPGDVLVLQNLGDFQLASDDQDAAKISYEAVLEIDPDNVIALNNLAWISREASPEQALAYVDKAIEIVGSDKSASLEDTKAAILLAQGEVVLARRSADKALALSPGDPDLLLSSAKISIAEGDASRARDELNQAIASGSQFLAREEAEALLSTLL